jgi:predicted DNA-binding transcriptional regulator AlpA
MIIDVITPSDLMQILGISKGTELAWRSSGILPRPVRLGRRVYYRRQEVAELFTIKQPKKNES